VVNARSVRLLAAKVGVEMPICQAVHAILYEGEDPRAAVGGLLARETRPER
jgi:glycerol-3-phosphate dehydrogenase (NAD(P)+)